MKSTRPQKGRGGHSTQEGQGKNTTPKKGIAEQGAPEGQYRAKLKRGCVEHSAKRTLQSTVPQKWLYRSIVPMRVGQSTLLQKGSPESEPVQSTVHHRVAQSKVPQKGSAQSIVLLERQ